MGKHHELRNPLPAGVLDYLAVSTNERTRLWFETLRRDTQPDKESSDSESAQSGGVLSNPSAYLRVRSVLEGVRRFDDDLRAHVGQCATDEAKHIEVMLHNALGNPRGIRGKRRDAVTRREAVAIGLGELPIDLTEESVTILSHLLDDANSDVGLAAARSMRRKDEVVSSLKTKPWLNAPHEADRRRGLRLWIASLDDADEPSFLKAVLAVMAHRDVSTIADMARVPVHARVWPLLVNALLDDVENGVIPIKRALAIAETMRLSSAPVDDRFESHLDRDGDLQIVTAALLIASGREHIRKRAVSTLIEASMRRGIRQEVLVATMCGKPGDLDRAGRAQLRRMIQRRVKHSGEAAVCLSRLSDCSNSLQTLEVIYGALAGKKPLTELEVVRLTHNARFSSYYGEYEYEEFVNLGDPRGIYITVFPRVRRLLDSLVDLQQVCPLPDIITRLLQFVRGRASLEERFEAAKVLSEISTDGTAGEVMAALVTLYSQSRETDGTFSWWMSPLKLFGLAHPIRSGPNEARLAFHPLTRVGKTLQPLAGAYRLRPPGTGLVDRLCAPRAHRRVARACVVITWPGLRPLTRSSTEPERARPEAWQRPAVRTCHNHAKNREIRGM